MDKHTPTDPQAAPDYWVSPCETPWVFDEININVTDKDGARVFNPRSCYYEEESKIAATAQLIVTAVNSRAAIAALQDMGWKGPEEK